MILAETRIIQTLFYFTIVWKGKKNKLEKAEIKADRESTTCW